MKEWAFILLVVTGEMAAGVKEEWLIETKNTQVSNQLMHKQKQVKNKEAREALP